MAKLVICLPTYIYLFCYLFLIFTFTSLPAQTEFLEKACVETANNSYIQNGFLGLAVVDTETSEVVYEYNGNKGLKPASSLKAITTATALSILGPDFKFETLLQYEGTITADSTLEGNIYIKGGGDPTLGYQRWNDVSSSKQVMTMWSEAIAKAGIKKINGCIIADDRIYESALVPKKWIWEDIGNYYGAGASALNFHENQYFIEFQTGKREGEQTHIVKLHPKQKGVDFVNEVETGGPDSGDQAFVYAGPYAKEIFIRGTVPPNEPNFSIKGSIPNPALFTAQSLESFLEKKGISCNQNAGTMKDVTAPDSSALRQLHQHLSPSLQDIVYHTNRKSVNLYCESMLKMIAYKKTGFGTTQKGIKQLERYWRSKGVNLHGSFIEDGSGLSPSNAVTPKHMALILSKIEKEPWFEEYKKSLFYRLGLYLSAKSGYINRVRAYAGFVTTDSGKLLSFSIMVNNYTCSNSAARVKLSAIMEKLRKIEI